MSEEPGSHLILAAVGIAIALLLLRVGLRLGPALLLVACVVWLIAALIRRRRMRQGP